MKSARTKQSRRVARDERDKRRSPHRNLPSRVNRPSSPRGEGSEPLKTTGATTTAKQPGGVTGKGFQPGQSGNPGGRPRSERKLLEGMFGEAGEKLYRQLEMMLAQPKTPVKLRAQIVMFLIERLHGKAPQRVDLEAGGDLVDLILAAARIAEGEKP